MLISKTRIAQDLPPLPSPKRIKYGQAQTVADALIEDGTYVYLAKIWKDIRNKETGKKQRKLFPFMNLLFAYMTEQEAEKYVRHSKMSQYTTYYYNHFITDENGHNPPLTVRSKDMEPLVRVTALLDEFGANHQWSF